MPIECRSRCARVPALSPFRKSRNKLKRNKRAATCGALARNLKRRTLEEKSQNSSIQLRCGARVPFAALTNTLVSAQREK
jgi:hypothetical protein